VSGQQHAPAALYPQERPSTHFTGGWVGPRASQGRQKIWSPLGFDPGPPSPYSVPKPTELPGPHTHIVITLNSYYNYMKFCNFCLHDKNFNALLLTIMTDIKTITTYKFSKKKNRFLHSERYGKSN